MAKRVIPRSKFAMHEERAEKIRKLTIAYIKKECKTNTPAVLLSSGVDSHLVLFAAMAAGMTPTVYSFTLDDRESQDFKAARRTAKLFGLKFVPVILSTDVRVIEKHVKSLYSDLNPGISLGKATVECLWPFFESMKIIARNGHRDCLSGLDGDIWFATVRSHKKAWEAGVYQEKVVNTFRRTVTAEQKKRSPSDWEGREAQQIMRGMWMAKYTPKLKLILPFNNLKLFDVMDNMDPFEEGNKPIQKAPFRLAFWHSFEHARENVYIHMSFQVGDTGIEEHFHKLLDTSLNTGGYKSPKGIYNTLQRNWETQG
jgi:hypothetical protein